MRLCRIGGRPSLLARIEMVLIDDGNRQLSPPMMAVCEEQGPGWASGLRELYKVVADEPIPSDFGDLLARIERRVAQGRSH